MMTMAAPPTARSALPPRSQSSTTANSNLTSAPNAERADCAKFASVLSRAIRALFVTRTGWPSSMDINSFIRRTYEAHLWAASPRHPAYFRAVETLVYFVLSVAPTPLTATMIAIEIRLAIMQYSMAVAADSSLAKRTSVFMEVSRFDTCNVYADNSLTTSDSCQ